MTSTHVYSIALVVALSVVARPAGAVNQDDFASFTGFDTFEATDFTIGPSGLGDAGPNNARFREGLADQFLGQQFYESSVGAWLIDGATTGVVDFENNNASSVAFVARSGPDDLIITALDDLGDPIGDSVRILGSSTEFQEVTFVGSIDRITLANLSTFVSGSSDLAAIDDFGFNSIPEPSSTAMLALAASFGVMLRHRCRE